MFDRATSFGFGFGLGLGSVFGLGLGSAAKCTEAECNTGCYQLQFDLQIRSEARGEAGSLGVGVLKK